MEKTMPRSLAPVPSITWFRSAIRACLGDNRAVSTAEYALVLAIIGAVIALAALGFSNAIGEAIDNRPIENAGDVQSGQAAFIRPGEMEVAGWYPLEFVAGPTLSDLKAESEDLPLTTPRSIYVSQKMRVSLLRDPKFEVRAKSKAFQDTGADAAASWQWDVKPKVEGTHTLIAQVDVLKRGTSGKLEVFNRYSRRVSVRVRVGTMQGLLNGIRNAETLGDALKTLFQSWRGTLIALAALLAAFFGVRWTYRKFRRRAPKPAELESGAES